MRSIAVILKSKQGRAWLVPVGLFLIANEDYFFVVLFWKL